MQLENYCQSCSIPMENPDMQGKEKDGSKSKDYCRYCYQHGEFTNPDRTLNEMTSVVINEMEKMHYTSKTIDMAISCLPHLKRWRVKEKEFSL